MFSILLPKRKQYASQHSLTKGLKRKTHNKESNHNITKLRTLDLQISYKAISIFNLNVYLWKEEGIFL